MAATPASGVISLSLFLSLFLFILSITSRTKCSDTDKEHRINVILIGATGDLAKKYLWQGLFDLFIFVQDKVSDRKGSKTGFRFYGAARLANEEGSRLLQDILRNSVKCSQEDCERKKSEFLKLCKYSRLKVQEDYEKLQNILEENLGQNEVEIGRLFYFSVPPLAYEDISRNIHSKCRPKNNGVWARVVLEKPFGSSFQTALELSKKLSKFWKEDEIYRIDHYLGKPGVRQIMEFRLENRLTYEKIWNRDYIEQVNIVLKEKGDVEGRMGFYDQYGVIRDVFQNHLTELLILVASELPEVYGKTESNSKKSELLKSLRIATLKDVVFGQYQQYNTQLRKGMPGGDVKLDSNTPTFAAVSMHIDNERWFGIPFLMVSGKSLDERLAYVEIQFKRSAFCVHSDLKNKHANCKPKDLVFYIQGGELKDPGTSISKSLPKVSLPNGWKNLDMSTSSILESDQFFITPPSSRAGAYSVLIRDVFLGNKKTFVSTDDLLLSWKIWTPLLEMSAGLSPRLYTPEKIEELDFEIVKGKMEFISEENIEKYQRILNDHHDRVRDRSDSFRGNKLHSGSTMDVVQQLANDIAASAQTKVNSGGTFHLALSGGSTPQRLFQTLAYDVCAFPWQQTHVWLVDERCVSLSHDQSNFGNIYRHLLKHVNIPFINIHAMQVDVAGRLCQRKDKTDFMYEDLLRYHTRNGSLDFVVLGVGNDGHTASLFPHQTTLSTRWVEVTNHGGLPRMTLTLPVLNRAKNVAILILGKNKIQIVSKLSEGVVDIDHLPITGVRAMNGSLSWYIDDDAF